MLKKYEYCKEIPKVWRKGAYAQEENLVHELLGGGEPCLRLEYSTKGEANNASQAIRRHCKKVATQPVRIHCRGASVYVLKEEKNAD